MKAIVEKAAELRSPIILGTSEGESGFFGMEEAVALRNVMRKKFNLPIFLNADHSKSFEQVKKAIEAGYDMVHFDGSKLPLEENIKITKQALKFARKKGALLEGEVGRIGTESSKLYSEKFEIKIEDLTKPEEAKYFLEKTGAYLLAVSIGNFHGIEISGVCPNLHINLLKEIETATNDANLVLHGGSGIPEDDIKEAIKFGIVKININTDLRATFSGNLRRSLNNDLEEIVPYKFLEVAKNSVKKLTGIKIVLFGSESKA